MVDFVRPDGTIAKVTIGDPRQLNDATFNAGLNSGSQYEYVDTANRLHFYVVDVAKDANGVLEYTLGVRLARRRRPADPRRRARPGREPERRGPVRDLRLQR